MLDTFKGTYTTRDLPYKILNNGKTINIVKRGKPHDKCYFISPFYTYTYLKRINYKTNQEKKILIFAQAIYQ